MPLPNHITALALAGVLSITLASTLNPEDESFQVLNVEVEELSTEDEELADQSPNPEVDNTPGADGEGAEDNEPVVISGNDLAQLIYDELRHDHRNSASILRAHQPRPTNNDEEDEDLADRDPHERALEEAGTELMRLIHLGDWQQVVEQARTYSNSESLISSIISNLSRGPHLMLVDDAMDLAVAIGDSPNPQQVNSLGSLLHTVMERSGERSHFLERLRNGIGPYGGNSSGGRARAASLLLAAGMELEAGPWLPELGSGWDLEILSLHARHWLARTLDESSVEAALQCLSLEERILDSFDPTVADEQRWARGAGLRILTLVAAMGEQPGFQQTLMHWLGERSLYPNGWHMLRTMVAQRLDSLGNTNEADLRVAVFDLALALAAMEPFPQKNDPFLSAMALNWLREARYARETAAIPEHMRQRRRNEIEAIDLQRLAALIPPEGILKLLDPDLGDGLRLESAEQVVARGNFSESVELVASLAEGQAERAAHLANQSLRVWVQGFDNSPQGNDNRYSRHYNYYGYYGSSPAIPLSRARQERRLEELASMVRQLEQASGQDLDIETVVTAFVACHSPAEIFHRRTMEAVFGEDPSPSQRLHLVSAMRQRLAGAWRQPQVQQQAQTQRNDEQLTAEVVRGYDLAADLIGEVAADDWRSLLMVGQVSFDHAEFLYGIEAPFATYAALRDSAFDAFAAADSAAAALKNAEGGRARVEVWSRWFDASLGASDLSYLTRQHEADHGRLRALRERVEASLAENGQLAASLALRLESQLRRVPGQLVHRYLEQACTLLTAVPAADGLRDHRAVLEELLGELSLEIEIVSGDGEQTIIGDQPFAVLISLGHSIDVGREAQNFDRYLSNQVYVNGEEVNFRDDFTKHLHDKLGQRCEIIDLRLYAPGDPSVAHRRPGWRSRPLAWAIVRAPDMAIDRLDPLRLDMDFSHQRSTVILPVSSPVIHLQRGQTPPLTENRGVDIRQTLAFHPDDEDVLLLEISANGRGIIPDWDTLLDGSFAGFTERARRDSGLSIEDIDSDGQRAQLSTSRRLHLELLRHAGTTHFAFPSPQIDGIHMSLHQRGNDGLVSSEQRIELTPPSHLGRWLSALFGLVVAIVAVVLIVRQRRAGSAAIPAPVANPPPSQPSALAAIQWLEQQLARYPDLDPATRQHFRDAIVSLEGDHYAPHSQQHTSSPDAICTQCHQLLLNYSPLNANAA